MRKADHEDQKTVTEWARLTFGNRDLDYCARNLLEEAVELSVACNLDKFAILDVVIGVLRRQQLSGFIKEESADVLLTLYRLASQAKFDLLAEGDIKMKKNRSRPQQYYDAKQELKRKNGIIK